MLTKQEILDRIAELDAECEAAMKKAYVDYENSYRHHKAKQGTQRLELMRECNLAGGHVFKRAEYPEDGMVCMFCGRQRTTESQQAASNLTRG